MVADRPSVKVALFEDSPRRTVNPVPPSALVSPQDVTKKQCDSVVVTLFANTEKRERENALMTDPSLMPPDVNGFVAANGLGGFIPEAVAAIRSSFGGSVNPWFALVEEPEDGSELLYVGIPVSDLEAGEYAYSKFCHSWWYDRVAKHGLSVVFQVVESVGL